MQQPKYTHNKSNLIKLTEEAKRKSRRRLIGSIFLLFIALLILLNITAKVKPIPINPEIVEIKNSKVIESISKNSASSALSATNTRPESASSVRGAMPEESAHASLSPSSTTASAPLAAEINQQIQAESHTPPETPETPERLSKAKQNKPAKSSAKKTIHEAAPELNPADILDGVENSHTAAKANLNKSSYLQFAALSSKTKAYDLQQALNEHGINASVQEITTQHGTLYRLRAGPFSRDTAQQKLQQMSNAGYNGIVTGK